MLLPLSYNWLVSFVSLPLIKKINTFFYKKKPFYELFKIGSDNVTSRSILVPCQ